MKINYSTALETINAPTTLVGIMLIGFMFWYVVDSHHDEQGRSIWRCWICGDLHMVLQFGVALFFLFVGGLIVRGWAWALRHAANTGSPFAPDAGVEWLVGGGVITLAAMVCLIRIVTIARFGKWPWRVAALLAIVSSIGTHYLPPF